MAKRSKGGKGTRSRLLTVAANAARGVEDRVAALVEAPLSVCESDADLQTTLGLLRDRDQPVEVRLAALQALQAASFSVITFESCRSDYIATLREVAGDPDPELRQRVLGILAREHDGFAQKKLLEGLNDPSAALVPPEKALQLLGYDVHAEAYAAAREVVEKPPNTAAKREALRLLAADSDSAPLFERILRDKDELPDLRQISAAALHSLRPDRLRAHMREILLDPDEADDVQATGLTALTQLPDDAAVAEDEELLAGIDRLSTAASTKVKQGARRFLSKYGR